MRTVIVIEHPEKVSISQLVQDIEKCNGEYEVLNKGVVIQTLEEKERATKQAILFLFDLFFAFLYILLFGYYILAHFSTYRLLAVFEISAFWFWTRIIFTLFWEKVKNAKGF